MIDHVTIPVKDLERSRKFYEAAFGPFGWKVEFGKAETFWAFGIGKGLFEIFAEDKDAAQPSYHFAFRAESREKVDEFYEAAIAAGAKCNGPPGPRTQYTENYYATFVLDPDGYNIEAMHDSWKDS